MLVVIVVLEMTKMMMVVVVLMLLLLLLLLLLMMMVLLSGKWGLGGVGSRQGRVSIICHQGCSNFFFSPGEEEKTARARDFWGNIDSLTILMRSMKGVQLQGFLDF